jgi:hypothetical protein
VATYLDVLRTSYFYSPWILAVVLVAFGVAAWQYSRQAEWVQWLIVAIPLQIAVIALHQTRFPRFLLLTVVLLCLVASNELGRWFAGTRARRVAGGVLAAAILIGGVAGANAAVVQERFRRIAFENYTDSASLRTALASIRGELTAQDRLAIIGEGNDVSPALFRWELGPASGAACTPFRIGGDGRLDLGLATRVLLLEARGADAGGFDVTDNYLAQRRTFLERVDRGEFALRRDLAVEDLHVALRLYDRTTTPDRLVPCD